MQPGEAQPLPLLYPITQIASGPRLQIDPLHPARPNQHLLRLRRHMQHGDQQGKGCDKN